MKQIGFLILGVILIVLSPNNTYAQEDFQPGIGLAVKASTNGLGGDIIYNFHQRLSVRLGAEMFSYDRDITFTEQDIDYDAVVDAKVGNISLLLDFYVAPWFFISGGAGYNLFHAEVVGHAASGMTFGDIVIPKEMIGNFQFDFDPSWKISPYFGIGFGRTISMNKKVGFAFEIGGFYQGPPDMTIQSSGLLSPTSNPDHGQELRLEKQINQYYLYPLLRFSLSYKIAQF